MGFCSKGLKRKGASRIQPCPGVRHGREGVGAWKEAEEAGQTEEEGMRAWGMGGGGETWRRNPGDAGAERGGKGQKGERGGGRRQGWGGAWEKSGEEPEEKGGAGRSRTRGGAGGEASKATAAAAAGTFGARSSPVGPTAGALPQPPLPRARALAAPADEDAPSCRRLPRHPGPAWSSSKPRTTTSCSRASVRCGAAAAMAASSSDPVRLAARGHPGLGEEGARPGPSVRGWRAGAACGPGGRARARARELSLFPDRGSARLPPAPPRGQKAGDPRPSDCTSASR